MLSFGNLKLSFTIYQVALCLLKILKKCTPNEFKMTSSKSKTAFTDACLRFDTPKTESEDFFGSVCLSSGGLIAFVLKSVPTHPPGYAHLLCLRYPRLQCHPTQFNCLRLLSLRPRSAPVILSSRTQPTCICQTACILRLSPTGPFTLFYHTSRSSHSTCCFPEQPHLRGPM